LARISASKRFRTIFALLEKHFGRRQPHKLRPPVEQALVTLLLQDGKEEAAERAIRRLERYFVDLNETRVCDAKELDGILGARFPDGVGQLVADTLTAIFNHAQAMNLDDIMALDPERAEAKLARLSRLPSRVAGELLLSNLGYQKLPQGAGMLRVATRTKLIRRGPASSQIRCLRRLVPKSMVPRVLHAFELLGERVCTAKDFNCRRCPLQELCPTGVEMLRRLEIKEAKERAAREAEEERVRKKRERERKARARKRAATAKLKKTIQVRSKKLKISPTKKKRKRRKKVARVVPTDAKMVQASSAEVKPDRLKKRGRRKARPKRRVRVSGKKKS